MRSLCKPATKASIEGLQSLPLASEISMVDMSPRVCTFTSFCQQPACQPQQPWPCHRPFLDDSSRTVPAIVLGIPGSRVFPVPWNVVATLITQAPITIHLELVLEVRCEPTPHGEAVCLRVLLFF